MTAQSETHYSDLQQARIANWEQHGYAEFALNSADAAIATMNDNPYILAVPLGQLIQGRQAVFEFYRDHFLCNIPDFIELEPLNRVIGEDMLVDSFIFRFDHDRELPWKIPGVPATGKRVEIPMTVFVGFDGDRIAYEHLFWDHAQVLTQIGVLDVPAAALGGGSAANLLRVSGGHHPPITIDRNAQ